MISVGGHIFIISLRKNKENSIALKLKYLFFPLFLVIRKTHCTQTWAVETDLSWIPYIVIIKRKEYNNVPMTMKAWQKDLPRKKRRRKPLRKWKKLLKISIRIWKFQECDIRKKIRFFRSRFIELRKKKKLKVISEMKTKWEGTQEKMTMHKVFSHISLNERLFLKRRKK